MAKEKLGNVWADCGPGRPGEFRHKVRVGVAFVEPNQAGDGERISIKIDALPIDGSGWTGWLNIVPNKNYDSEPEG